jgi:spermidine synthase
MWVSALYGLHSGISMAYEVVWIRLLAVTLGQTLAAMSLVLLAITAGLGLGAALVSQVLRMRLLSPRQLFVSVQLALGVSGAAFPSLLQAGEQLYIALAPSVASSLHAGLRLAVSAALLLPLSCLIGAVFPLLSAGMVSPHVQTAGRGVGRLYWHGLVWSGLGALLTPLWLLRVLGSTYTSLLLGALHGLAALCGRWLHDFSNPAGAPDHTATIRPQTPTYPLVWLVSALLGGGLFTVESIGAKYLWLIVDATVYTEGLLLGMVLLGMGVGTALYGVLRKCHWSAEAVLTGSLILFGGWIVLWLFLAAWVAAAFAALLPWTLAQDASAGRFWALYGALVGVVLGGPASATGMGFPALCELAIRRQTSVTHAIGKLTAWHYVGAGLGTAGTTFLLLPILGMTWSLALLSTVLLLTAVTWWRHTTRWAPQTPWVWASAAGILIGGYWLGRACDVTFQVRAAGAQHRVVLHHEDGSGVVEVYEEQHTGQRLLMSSRLRQEGGDRPEDLRVQRLQGALPVLLHPAPRHMLVVGLGTGISLAASLRSEVEHVTCVELSPGIIKAAALFAQTNNHILTHPQVTLLQQDGRNFMRLSRAHYDLVVQDLFFPYRAGVGNLYTQEHYQRIRARLRPQGRVAQWIALNQVGLVELRSLVRTFTSVFPETSLWLTGGYLLLYGGAEPFSLAWPAFQQRMAADVPVNSTNAADVLSMFIAAGPAVRQWAANATLNTDDTAFIEFHLLWAFATLNTVRLAAENLAALLPLHQPVGDVVTQLTVPEQQQLAPASQAAYWLWHGIIARARGDLEQARQLYERAYALHPVSYQVRSFLAQDLAARGRQALLHGQAAEAETFLRRALTIDAHHAEAQFDLALVQAGHGDDAAAVATLQRLLHTSPTFPHGAFNLGISLYKLARYQEAAEQFKRAVAADPASIDGLFNLANSLAKTGQYAAAIQWYQRTLTLQPDHRLARDNLQAVQDWYWRTPQR